MTYWTSYSDKEWHYWGGVTYSSDSYDEYAMCACGVNKSCIEQDINCNCDRVNETDDFLQDDGYLEYADHLPIKAFHAGDTGTLTFA